MEEKKRKLPKVLKILAFLLFGAVIIGLAILFDYDGCELIGDFLPDSLFDGSKKEKKKGNEENTDEVL